MSFEIKVPMLGESVSEASVAKWHKSVGSTVKVDELLLELETDKVTLEVTATASGVLKEIKYDKGSSVKVGDVLGYIEAAGAAPVPTPTPKTEEQAVMSPAARKMVEERAINPADITGTGKDGRITKEDVLNVSQQKPCPTPAEKKEVTSAPTNKRVEVVKMTNLRKRIATRLKESQNTAAILTTFNEIDMTNILSLRQKYRDKFEKKHGIKMGFMSFFVKAVVTALKEIPALNAEINEDEITYKYYYDIGVAVGTEQGLIVPVLRNTDQLSFAEIELAIAELGKKAREGKLTVDDLSGATFTISNGGVYGSLFSTPIINPPQSGILGMHKTQDRAVVVDGKIEIRPMMYVALSYDHRLIDGKEAVTFLVRVKELAEDPEKLLLNI
jgi:2-oxoglutarate dehydrogenase E2 component (dihydrolipoamide succinyltransferase)